MYKCLTSDCIISLSLIENVTVLNVILIVLRSRPSLALGSNHADEDRGKGRFRGVLAHAYNVSRACGAAISSSDQEQGVKNKECGICLLKDCFDNSCILVNPPLQNVTS